MKKVTEQELIKTIKKMCADAKKRGFKTLLISEPVLKTHGAERTEADMSQISITFTKPTKPKRIIYYQN